MTDRELLEIAAKAAGVPQNCYRHGIGGMWQYTPQDGYFGACWNPLDDDGDALRLAVKLRLQVTPGTYKTNEVGIFRAGAAECYETGIDLAAATRRAIVRAAAAMA